MSTPMIILPGLREFFGAYPDTGTPLNFAILYRNVAALKELIRRGSDPMEKECNSNYPLYHAVGDPISTGWTTALKLFLDAGADATDALGARLRK